MNTCGTCKSWVRDENEEVPVTLDANVAECRAIARRGWWQDVDRVPVFLSNAGENSVLLTHREFGCLSHEPYQAATPAGTVNTTHEDTDQTMADGEVVIRTGKAREEARAAVRRIARLG